uniref:Hypothetical centromere protein F n=1 Tax=Sorghum bicolor TaxID=4558 RepID=B3VTD0_SORBI|nr:hypothetical centromere protein F [Sorghum bicolor]
MAALLDPPLPVPILKVLAATGTTRTATAVAPAVGGPDRANRATAASTGQNGKRAKAADTHGDWDNGKCHRSRPVFLLGQSPADPEQIEKQAHWGLATTSEHLYLASSSNVAVQALLQFQIAESYRQEGLRWSDMCMLHGMHAREFDLYDRKPIDINEGTSLDFAFTSCTHPSDSLKAFSI